jgi:LAS superfamily LD-carboxypeptidase LdcB
MKRRTFIKQSSITGLVLLSIPRIVFASNSISEAELIGKGTPTLFGENYQLREEANNAFLQMKEAALKHDINIQIISSYRSFKHQKRIWTRKFKRYQSQGFSELESINKIIEYSTIPGTSRHHWATDIDIIDGNSHYSGNVFSLDKFEINGTFNKLKIWMNQNANRFGFYLVYTNNPNRKGFKYEPWHYSYMPLSKTYLKAYKQLNVSKILKNEQIIGSDFFSDGFIKKYRSENILDINPKLL